MIQTNFSTHFEWFLQHTDHFGALFCSVRGRIGVPHDNIDTFERRFFFIATQIISIRYKHYNLVIGTFSKKSGIGSQNRNRKLHNELTSFSKHHQNWFQKSIFHETFKIVRFFFCLMVFFGVSPGTSIGTARHMTSSGITQDICQTHSSLVENQNSLTSDLFRTLNFY